MRDRLNFRDQLIAAPLKHAICAARAVSAAGISAIS